MSSQKGASSAKGGKGGKKAAGKGSTRDEEETEEKLQAVILADDFDTRFRPFTEEKPRCLLPLANTPLIAYTLEWLAMSGVSEVYIYPGAETAAEVEAYIQDSEWNPKRHTSSFDVVSVITSKATSIGEAMRDLDRRKVMNGDFLVVHGDLVCNLSVADALAKHKARRAKDKNAVMTMLLGEVETAGPQSKTPIYIVNRAGRCLYYEEVSLLKKNTGLSIPEEVMSSNSDIEIRSDLIDPGIDICTPDVLALWSDEFDYQNPRSHFLHGVLKDFELNGKLIYTDIIGEGYAARVNTLQAYDAVSRDVLNRWTFPLVPDNNIVTGQTYKTEGRTIKEDGVILSRATKLGDKTVVGSKTSIGEGVKIRNATIGRRCQIGKNVIIRDAYIWDDVLIGDGAHITGAIIGSESVIGNNTQVSGGTVMGFGVRIAANMLVNEGHRITRGNRQLANSKPTDVAVVGEGGSGYVFIDEEEPEDEEEEEFLKAQNNMFYNMDKLAISSESVSTVTSETSDMASSLNSRRFSAGSLAEDDESDFHNDAVQGLYDTLQEEKGDFDSAKLEFMGLRLSNNATDKEIRRAIAVAFTKNMVTLVTENKLNATAAVKRSLDKKGAIQFVNEVAIGKSKVVLDQVEFMYEVQRSLSSRIGGAEILFALCDQFYEREVIEEEGFEGWWEYKKSIENEEMVNVRAKAQAFMTWLREADEDDSDEESSDEED